MRSFFFPEKPKPDSITVNTNNGGKYTINTDNNGQQSTTTVNVTPGAVTVSHKFTQARTAIGAWLHSLFILNSFNLKEDLKIGIWLAMIELVWKKMIGENERPSYVMNFQQMKNPYFVILASFCGIISEEFIMRGLLFQGPKHVLPLISKEITYVGMPDLLVKMIPMLGSALFISQLSPATQPAQRNMTIFKHFIWSELSDQRNGTLVSNVLSHGVYQGVMLAAEHVKQQLRM